MAIDHPAAFPRLLRFYEMGNFCAIPFTAYHLLLLFPLLAITSYLAYRRWKKHRLCQQLQCQLSGPSYNHIDPLFGLDFIYDHGRNIRAHRFAEGLRDGFGKYGTTYSSRMGFQDIIHTIDPVNLETIMKSQARDYDIIPHRSRIVELVFGKGVFSTNQDERRVSRDLVHRGLAGLRLLGRDQGIDDAYEDGVQAMIERIRRMQAEGREGVTIDFGAAARRYTSFVARSVIFGREEEKEHDSDCEAEQFCADFAILSKIAQSMTLLANTILSRYSFVYAWLWKDFRRVKWSVFHYVDRRTEGILQTRDGRSRNEGADERKGGTARSVLEEILLSSTRGREQDLSRIRGEALNLFLAGNDTVHIALTELFWLLTRSPETWQKLREEVGSALNGRQPAFQELRELTYLRWVINEAFRLRPTLAAHARIAHRNTVLPRGGGPSGLHPLLVAKGTYVAYSNYALHRDPNVFGADVDVFRPERWASIKPSKFEFLPFGVGQRRCPGEKMGWSMVTYAVVRLAQEVERLQPPREGEDLLWEEAGSFAFFNRHGVHLRVGWCWSCWNMIVNNL
ncbi:Putative cytochrome P450 [Septoria linicola]|uniref:Cytochrome P450 n=1 Tax=Septoria linicola TaxID=215465 RepID=A0A9Q9AGA6_9PEZI|nr:putative cytochrome P450 [Septoria linicola]USW47034.1 Putative cytochrome P450 [Septoria linicola]